MKGNAAVLPLIFQLSRISEKGAENEKSEASAKTR